MDNEHKEFLDDLRESGVTNMFGAGPYIEIKFALSKAESNMILREWMKSF